MNGENKNIVERLAEEIYLYDSIESFEYFAQGVRCGMKLYEELKHIEIDSIQGKADFING